MSCYPIHCVGGFSVPVKKGKFEVKGFTVTVSDPTIDSAFMIVDDPTINEDDLTGKIIGSEAEGIALGTVLAYVKGDGSAYTPTLEWCPPEPIKTRHGISVYALNTLAGACCVYTG